MWLICCWLIHIWIPFMQLQLTNGVPNASIHCFIPFYSGYRLSTAIYIDDQRGKQEKIENFFERKGNLPFLGKWRYLSTEFKQFLQVEGFCSQETIWFNNSRCINRWSWKLFPDETPKLRWHLKIYWAQVWKLNCNQKGAKDGEKQCNILRRVLLENVQSIRTWLPISIERLSCQGIFFKFSW